MPCSGPDFRAVCTAHLEAHPSNHCQMEKQFPIIQNRRSVALHLPPRSPSSLLPPPNWKLLDLSLQTNLPDTRDGPHLSHGSVSSPSKLSPQSSYRVRTEFVGLKSVSDRSLGTLVFIRVAALRVPRSQRDVSLHVWQLGKLSPPPPPTLRHVIFVVDLSLAPIRESRRQIRTP